MNINIIGIDGFIGGHLFRHLRSINAFAVNGTYFDRQIDDANLYLDITDKSNLEDILKQFDHCTLILLSASKDVKKCEQDGAFAHRINTQPIKDIIDIITAFNLDIRFIFFSSDYVFDGQKGNYEPTSMLNPRTNYGKTKRDAEVLLSNSSISYKIIRTSAVMGIGSVFFDWLRDALMQNKDLELYTDVYFTPTPINFLCEVMAAVLVSYDEIHDMIIHIVGGSRFSRYQLAQLVQSLLPEHHARIVPAECANNASLLFQRDLSMLQSDCVRKLQTQPFETYLKDLL